MTSWAMTFGTPTRKAQKTLMATSLQRSNSAFFLGRFTVMTTVRRTDFVLYAPGAAAGGSDTWSPDQAMTTYGNGMDLWISQRFAHRLHQDLARAQCTFG